MPTKTYRVSYSHWDGEDTHSVHEDVLASSLHEAIGIAWPFLQADVENYGGDIDDLDGWEIEETKNYTYVRLSVAQRLFRSLLDKTEYDWYALPNSERDKYLRAVDLAIKEVT